MSVFVFYPIILPKFVSIKKESSFKIYKEKI